MARLAPKIRRMKQKIKAFDPYPYNLGDYYDELYNLSEGLRTASHFNDFVEGIKTFFFLVGLPFGGMRIVMPLLVWLTKEKNIIHIV